MLFKAQPCERVRNQGSAKLLAICFFAFLLAFGGVIVILQPYKRLEGLVGHALTQYAPEGTTIGSIDVSFPLRIRLTELAVPVMVNDSEQRILLDAITGKISFHSLLRGKIRYEVTTDLFGGLVWLRIKPAPGIPTSSGNRPFLALETRTRGLDIAQICDFLQAQVRVEGRCDADFEAEFKEGDVESLNGQGLAIAKEMDIPVAELEGIVLPWNPDSELNLQITAREGAITVETLNLTGGGYDLSGTGVIKIADSLDSSPVDGSFWVLFKEPPTITDENLLQMGGEYIVEAVTNSQSKLYFKLAGTFNQPEWEFDTATSLSSILEQSSQ